MCEVGVYGSRLRALVAHPASAELDGPKVDSSEARTSAPSRPCPATAMSRRPWSTHKCCSKGEHGVMSLLDDLNP